MVTETPTILNIFGITGDLSVRKILPSLWYLHEEGRLPERLVINGIARRQISDEDLEALVKEAITKNGQSVDRGRFAEFISHFVYLCGDLNDLDTYERLVNSIGDLESEWGVCANKLFYLSVPPSTYENIFKNLATVELNKPCGGELGWSRLLIEKPFGSDEKSARALQSLVSRYFKEEQIYRIDHYLFKEIFQGIENFRFSNNLFEHTWDNTNIERIDLRLCESIGVEKRGLFYESVGALRDVGQNHLLEMLAAITMDYPESSDDKAARQGRAKLLQSLKPLSKQELSDFTYRAQYEGYRDIEGVATNSEVETYFAFKTELKNQRWAGVPIYFEGGKSLGVAQKEIVLTLKHPKVCHLCEVGAHGPNKIVFRYAPNDEIIIHFWTKAPGFEHKLEERQLSFFLHERADQAQYVEEYAKILNEAMLGQQRSFISNEEVMALWDFVDPITKAWQENETPLHHYEIGTKPRPPFMPPDGVGDSTSRPSKGALGVVGLGKMGSNLALRLRDSGWQVSGYNETPVANQDLKQAGVTVADSLKGLVDSLSTPRLVWLMVPHQAVDDVLTELMPMLEAGDSVIDGGNSFYKNSKARAQQLAEKGINFLDVGVSGGPAGALNGACLMIGGSEKVFKDHQEFFKDLASPDGYAYLGESGAGHFVKMVHNGIEYGMMQAIAEGFSLMKQSEYDLNLLKVAKLYNHASVIESRLVGWLADAYRKYGSELNTKECCSGTVAHSGEGQWTVETAKEFGLPVKIIEEALLFREQSTEQPSYTGQVVSALRHEFGGHDASRKEGEGIK